MRLHHLRLQAFGPFAGTEQIDFDRLAAGGLHLIHGPTGAGKTSILDAICFALFAGVPGGRMQGRETLHSDHADATARPEVELEFAVGAQRLRIRRSPEHQVAKKRGTGTRTQRGDVTLEERRDGTWRTISTRADEVAQTIGELIGMGLPQFAQVMLLPQGEFTAFLRAKPDDRGRLLERLFDISDFAAVERWLADHRKALETQCVQAESERATVIARVREALSEVTHDSPLFDEGVSPDTHDGQTWSPAVLHERADHLSGRMTEALATADDAARRVERLRARLAEQQALAAWQRQAHEAQQTLQQVSARAARIADAEQALVAAARADRCATAIAAVDRRRHTLERAERTAHEHLADLSRSSAWPVPEPHHADGLSATALEPLVERAAAGTHALSGQPEVLRRLRTLEGDLRTAARDLATAQQHADHRRAAADAATTQLVQLQSRHRKLLPDASAHPAWQRLLDDLGEAGTLLESAHRDAAAALAAEQEHERTRRAWAGAEREVLRLRNARLAGIAAELADGLADGSACPVCGSTDHPHRAEPGEDQVDADQVAAAEEDLSVATTHVAEAAGRWSSLVGHAHATCRATLDVLARISDGTGVADVETTTVEVSSARTDLKDAGAEHRRTVTQLIGADGTPPGTTDPALPAALRSLADVLAGARETVAAHVTRTATASRQVAVLEQQLRAFEDERDAAQQAVAAAAEAVRLGEAEHRSLESQLEAARRRVIEMTDAHATACGCCHEGAADPAAVHAGCVERLEALRGAVSAQHTAASEHAAARAEADRLLDEAQFADAASATAARLSERDQQELVDMVRAHHTAEAKAAGVLEQPEVAAAVTAPPATVDEVTEELGGAERTARHTHEAVGRIRRVLDKLRRLAEELAEHDERSAPLREQLRIATSLAAAVAGSGDNTMRMRLTAYVLAARLESVTALANQRLRHMTDGRYQLEHTDERAARGSKSGLGLRVRDAWTGTTRGTATLSGGESFIASLALALGLGDAVLEAAGGRRLETLLVDEGFGSLDEDSLEHVLDVLDGLRAGGRNVGIVSHVPELRARIPAQIRVCKTARGSTLEVVTSAVA